MINKHQIQNIYYKSIMEYNMDPLSKSKTKIAYAKF